MICGISKSLVSCNASHSFVYIRACANTQLIHLPPLTQVSFLFKDRWIADLWKRHCIIPNKISKLLIFLITTHQGFPGDLSDHLPHKNVTNFFVICFD